MNSIQLLEKIRYKPVFRIQDIKRIAYVDSGYAKQILNRLTERKIIKQVMRNVYTAKDDIFVIASNISPPSYISFWSASHFLGYTEQIVNTIQVATTKKLMSVKFQGYTIKFIPLKHFFGYKKIRTVDGEIFMAEDEKLLIDAFMKPKECGNFDEIEKIFKNSDISEKKLIEYLHMMGSQTVIKRVGYLVEKMRGYDISKSFSLNRNYVTLNPFSHRAVMTNSKWRIKT